MAKKQKIGTNTTLATNGWYTEKGKTQAIAIATNGWYVYKKRRVIIS